MEVMSASPTFYPLISLLQVHCLHYRITVSNYGLLALQHGLLTFPKFPFISLSLDGKHLF